MSNQTDTAAREFFTPRNFKVPHHVEGRGFWPNVPMAGESEERFQMRLRDHCNAIDRNNGGRRIRDICIEFRMAGNAACEIFRLPVPTSELAFASDFDADALQEAIRDRSISRKQATRLQFAVDSAVNTTDD